MGNEKYLKTRNFSFCSSQDGMKHLLLKICTEGNTV